MVEMYVGIPCYNGSKTVADVIDRVKKQGVTKIIVVNDGSTDTSLKILKKRNDIILVNHEVNRGFGGAQKSIFNKFKEISQKKDWVVLVHSDGQLLPEELPKFKEKIEKTKAQIIFGARTLDGRKDVSFIKKKGDKFFTSLQNWCYNLNLTTYATGYRAFSHMALDKISYEELNNRHSFDSEIIVEIAEKKVPYTEVIVTPVYNDEISNYNMFEYCYNISKKALHYKFFKKKKKNERK